MRNLTTDGCGHPESVGHVLVKWGKRAHLIQCELYRRERRGVQMYTSIAAYLCTDFYDRSEYDL